MEDDSAESSSENEEEILTQEEKIVDKKEDSQIEELLDEIHLVKPSAVNYSSVKPEDEIQF